MNLLYIVVLGFALFFAMQLINRLSLLIPGESRWRNLLLRSLPLAEFVVWVTYAFWAATIVFSGLPYRGVVESVMALVLVLALGWYVLRDFLNGILLKTENELRKGQSIKTSFVSGKITGIGYRTLQIENDKGEKVRVPYSRLGETIITRPPQKGQSHSHMLKFSLSTNKNPVVLPVEISRELLNMPWIITEEDPSVNLVHDADGQLMLEIKFSVLKEEHALLIEQNLNALLKKAEE